MVTALINGRVLRDAGFVEGHAVLIANGRITGIVPDDALLRGATPHDLGGHMLLPGFIDTQVNGGGGMLFGDAPGVEALRAIGAAHRPFGTTGFLPTLISADPAVIRRALDAVRAAMCSEDAAARVPGVLGIHIEGPYLNPARRGVHDSANLRTLDAAAIELLATPTGGATLVTLAPEMTTPDAIAALARRGVTVSAGHSDATCATVQAALAAGLRGFTHLFNAMTQLGSREPGVVGAALDDADSYCGVIVDGHHVAPLTLRLALRCKRPDRVMLVSDAMPNIGHGDGHGDFALQGRRIRVHDGKLLDEDGGLAGANLTMAGAVANAVKLLGLDVAAAARMAAANPAAFLRLDGLGHIEPGFRASLVSMDDTFTVRETWIDGAHVRA